jgi:hypothetical protein
MNKLKVRSIVLLVAGILAVLAVTPTYAVETHFYAATHGLSASFYRIVGSTTSTYMPSARSWGLMPPNHVAAFLAVTSSAWAPPRKSRRSGLALLFLFMQRPVTCDLEKGFVYDFAARAGPGKHAHARGVPF